MTKKIIGFTLLALVLLAGMLAVSQTAQPGMP